MKPREPRHIVPGRWPGLSCPADGPAIKAPAGASLCRRYKTHSNERRPNISACCVSGKPSVFLSTSVLPKNPEQGAHVP